MEESKRQYDFEDEFLVCGGTYSHETTWIGTHNIAYFNIKKFLVYEKKTNTVLAKKIDDNKDALMAEKRRSQSCSNRMRHRS